MDDNLNFTQKDKATVDGKAYELNGHIILDCYSKSTGRVFLSASFKDSTLAELDGLFRTFNADRNLESEGNYSNNEMNGVWKYWNTHGLLTDSVIYRDGIRVAFANYEYFFKRLTLQQYFGFESVKNNLLSMRYSFTDSLKNTFSEKEIGFYEGKPVILQEADFTGQTGILKINDSTGALKNTEAVNSRVLSEATFPGGDGEWRQFMVQNLNPIVPVNKNAPDGTYTVFIKFIVEPDGSLTNIESENDPGYGTAGEAMRVLKLSPKWKPANQYGRYVRAYRRQPISFMVESSIR